MVYLDVNVTLLSQLVRSSSVMTDNINVFSSLKQIIDHK